MNFKFPQFSATPLASMIPQVVNVCRFYFEVDFYSIFSGKQGGSQPDGGYAKVGPEEETKRRKSSSLSLLPGDFLEAFIFNSI